MSQRQGRRALEVFVVEEGRDGGRNWWNKVGGGFENNDGSLSIRLHLFPDLLLQVRDYVPPEERGRGGGDDRGRGRGSRDRRGRGRERGGRGGRGGGDRGRGHRDDDDDGPPAYDDDAPLREPDDYDRGAPPDDDDIPF